MSRRLWTVLRRIDQVMIPDVEEMRGVTTRKAHSRM